MTDLRTGRPCRDRELAYAAVLADGTNAQHRPEEHAEGEPGKNHGLEEPHLAIAC